MSHGPRGATLRNGKRDFDLILLLARAIHLTLYLKRLKLLEID
jgi:hypothetical protein